MIFWRWGWHRMKWSIRAWKKKRTSVKKKKIKSHAWNLVIFTRCFASYKRVRGLHEHSEELLQPEVKVIKPFLLLHKNNCRIWATKTLPFKKKEHLLQICDRMWTLVSWMKVRYRLHNFTFQLTYFTFGSGHNLWTAESLNTNSQCCCIEHAAMNTMTWFKNNI